VTSDRIQYSEVVWGCAGCQWDVRSAGGLYLRLNQKWLGVDGGWKKAYFFFFIRRLSKHHKLDMVAQLLHRGSTVEVVITPALVGTVVRLRIVLQW
jgi:hypothetical protein